MQNQLRTNKRQIALSVLFIDDQSDTAALAKELCGAKLTTKESKSLTFYSATFSGHREIATCYKVLDLIGRRKTTTVFIGAKPVTDTRKLIKVLACYADSIGEGNGHCQHVYIDRQTNNRIDVEIAFSVFGVRVNREERPIARAEISKRIFPCKHAFGLVNHRPKTQEEWPNEINRVAKINYCHACPKYKHC